MHVVLFSEQARFLNFIQRIKTGLILLDFDMGSICGIEVIRQLRCCNVALPIICVSDNYKICEMGESLRLIGCQFIAKAQLPIELSTMVKPGAKQFDSALFETGCTGSLIKNRFSKLTPRELEVLSGLISGDRSKAIAFRLNVSCRTIELHRANIMSKLEISSMTELIKILLLSDGDEVIPLCKSYLQLSNHYLI